jgi:hypothetical protein
LRVFSVCWLSPTLVVLRTDHDAAFAYAEERVRAAQPG